MNEDTEMELERSLIFGWKRKIIEHDVKTKVIPKTLINYTGLTKKEELEILEEMEEGIDDFPIFWPIK